MKLFDFNNLKNASRNYYMLIAIFALLGALGVIAWAVQLMDGLVVTDMRNIVSWGLYISAFAWFVGVSAGGLIISSSAAVFEIKDWKPLAKLANLVAAVAILFAALQILPDLGRPQLILNLILHPNFESPLTWDIIIIATYLLISVTELFLLMQATSAEKAKDMERAQRRERQVKMLAYVALPVAVLTHTITAWIFGLQIGRPFWNTALLAPLFLASALVSGLALVMLVTYLADRFSIVSVKKSVFATFAKLLAVLILVDLFLIFCEYVTVMWGAVPEETAPLLTAFFGGYGWLGWLQWIVAFTALAILLYPPAREQLFGKVLAPVLVLAYVFIYRINLVMNGFIHPLVDYPPGLSVGEYAAGQSSFMTFGHYAPTLIEWAIVIGMMAGAALVITLAIRVLPIGDKN